MTHNFERADWKTELVLSAFSACLFGGTNIIVGHPMDLIKTKMQAQSDMLEGHATLMSTIKSVYQNEGLKGFY